MEEYRGIKFVVAQDEDSFSPREDDNFGTMICSHRRYNLGDEQAKNCEDYSSWDEWFSNEIGNNVIALPLYLYDHSGITISTTPFSCRWDSGQVGYIYVEKEKIRKEFNVKRISPKLKKQVLERLVAEVETYDYYIRGEIYLYEVEDDCCGGFYGNEAAEEAAKEAIDNLLSA